MPHVNGAVRQLEGCPDHGTREDFFGGEASSPTQVVEAVWVEVACIAVLCVQDSSTEVQRHGLRENWSGYYYIWSKKRNRLDTVSAGKLVYVFMNFKLSCQSLTKWTEIRMMMDLNYEETRKPCSTQSSEDTKYAHDVAEGRVHFEESDPKLIIDIENDDVDIMFKAPSFRRSKRFRGLEHYASAHP